MQELYQGPGGQGGPGDDDDDCDDFVVYNDDDDQVFACGTHAFKPQCSWRNVREIGKVTRLIDGRAKCPYR